MKKRKTAILNDQELDVVLKKARMPEISARYWEKFPERVVKRLCPSTIKESGNRKTKSG